MTIDLGFPFLLNFGPLAFVMGWFAPRAPRAIKNQRRCRSRSIPAALRGEDVWASARPVQARPPPSSCHFCRRLALA
jgi:hypothetical protein